MRLLSFLRPAGVAIAACAVACGANPTAPAALDRIGLSAGPSVFVTTPIGCTGTAPGVGANLELSHEGAQWVARSSTPADGSVVFRFNDAGGLAGRDIPVVGTLTGMGIASGADAAFQASIFFMPQPSGAPVAVSGFYHSTFAPDVTVGFEGDNRILTNTFGEARCSLIGVTLRAR